MPWPVSATAISTNSPLSVASHEAQSSLSGDATDANVDAAVAADRIARIDQQIQHNLLQLHRIDLDRRFVLRRGRFHVDRLRDRGAQHARHFGDAVADLDDHRRAAMRARERQHLRDQIARALTRPK